MNLKEVAKWCKDHSFFGEEEILIVRNIDGSYSFHGNLRINSGNVEIKDLPFKIDTIKGDFEVDGIGLNSFKNFPRIVEGDMSLQNNKFSSWSGWEVQEVAKTINLCGYDCNLPNLDGLYDTTFAIIHLKMSDSIFKDNLIPKEIYKEYDSKSLTYNEFNILKDKGIINNNSLSVDEYLNELFNEKDLDIIQER